MEFAQWVVDAAKDGWNVAALYNSEPAESFAKLTKGRWSAHYDNRPYPNARGKIQRIYIWGPDGLQITVTPELEKTYDGKTIESGLRNCMYCSARDVETTCISFAGRCCLKCRGSKELTDKLEYPGWTN